MASKQQLRKEFVAIMAREVPAMPLQDVRRIMSASATLDRLAVAQCNGEYPCDNGERSVTACMRCESLYAPQALSAAGVCPDCRTKDRVERLCEPFGIVPQFHGDPRGCVLKLKMPSGRGNDFGGEGLVCVP